MWIGRCSTPLSLEGFHYLTEYLRRRFQTVVLCETYMGVQQKSMAKRAAGNWSLVARPAKPRLRARWILQRRR